MQRSKILAPRLASWPSYRNSMHRLTNVIQPMVSLDPLSKIRLLTTKPVLRPLKRRQATESNLLQVGFRSRAIRCAAASAAPSYGRPDAPNTPRLTCSMPSPKPTAVATWLSQSGPQCLENVPSRRVDALFLEYHPARVGRVAWGTASSEGSARPCSVVVGFVLRRP